MANEKHIYQDCKPMDYEIPVDVRVDMTLKLEKNMPW